MSYAVGQYDGSGQPPSRTLWMGELESWMDENYLRQLWWSIGELVTCRISADKYGAAYAFIEFQTPEGATKAIALNGTPIPQTNNYFKLNWSNRDGNGQPFANNIQGGPNAGAGDFSIFVGDLGADVDDNVLMVAFQSRYSSARSAKVMIDSVTGYSRGFGFIRFLDENDQLRALEEMQGVYIGSRPVRVSPARPRAQFEAMGPTVHESEISTVFVGGLNNTITEEELRVYFGSLGNITAFKMIPAKNIAFIQFEHRVSAEQAISELNGNHLGGAKLRLSFGRTQLNTGPFNYGGVPPQHMYPPHPQAMLPPPPPLPQPVIDYVPYIKPSSVQDQNNEYLACQESQYANWISVKPT